ncbi:hypothetical protein GCM10020358_59860 [Amorphoplanes nipponensis]|uniref:HTH cro/C1-type domain-containing protein n=1 Tax=Actinoplanes nipponensis TaxID=135950 RepID=A0A919J9N8_9ACTN|nr:helix-turn-helix domain-containing protein [Actinoplanes nipponensis]GIE46964.1 hypothetical protein Ani05nite_04980 [Actinoplanes nipponensis]
MHRYDACLADELVAARRRANITQEELAFRTGLSVRSIRNLESARVVRPRQATVRLLREALGLPAEPPTTVRTRPMQLPLDVPGFVGRTRQIAQLDRLVKGDPRLPATVVVCTLAGAPGIGKTTLALHWAHRAARRFADGVLHVDLGGSGPGESVMAPGDALGGLIESLLGPGEAIPRALVARAGLYRSLLAGRRMLIVLDDARDADHVRPLLPGVAGSVVVVTSRDPLAGLVAREVAHPIAVDPLTPGEGRRLLRARLGERRLAAEPEPVRELVEHCGGVPRCLAAAAAQAVLQPGLPLSEVVRRLRQTG